MKTAIRELRKTSGAMRCLECGKCSTLCPLSAYGNYSVARMSAIHDDGEHFDTLVSAIDRCLTCGACELRCPQGVRFTEFVRGLRGRIPSASRSPCPHGNALQASARLEAAGNGKRRSLDWLTDDLRVADEGEVALFVGCLPLFDLMFEGELGIRPTEIARAAIRLMNLAGIEPVVIAEEKCCGHDLLWNGDDETFRALAVSNVEAFRARGVKRIVTSCAECYRTWKIDYADAVPDYKPRVEHLSEFLAPLVESGELVFSDDEPARVTFQDPCRLARHLGVVDPPRDLLATIGGTEIVEMEKHGRDAQCCGTAGFIHCDRDSRRMQAERLASASATGADVLVTACPKCWIHFTCAQHENETRKRNAPKIRIEDLTLFAGRHAVERKPAPAEEHSTTERGVSP